MMMTNTQAPANCNNLVIDAINKPGTIMQRYSAFYDYALGNQLLALFQCHLRGLSVGPIKTFPGWKNLGRSVRKREKALTLCTPITIKHRTVVAKATLTYMPILNICPGFASSMRTCAVRVAHRPGRQPRRWKGQLPASILCSPRSLHQDSPSDLSTCPLGLRESR